MLHFVTVVLTFLEEWVHSWMYHGIYLGQKISVFDKVVKRKRGGGSPFSCINHVYEKNQQLSTVTVKYFNQNPGKFSGHYSQFLLHHCIPFTTFVLFHLSFSCMMGFCSVVIKTPFLLRVWNDQMFPLLQFWLSTFSLWRAPSALILLQRWVKCVINSEDFCMWFGELFFAPIGPLHLTEC